MFKSHTNTTVLYCVLNWGLGHASRSSQVIDELIKRGVNVIICSDGNALYYLDKRFPSLKKEELPPYNIKYSKGKHQSIKIAQQIPKIASVIKKENRIISQLAKIHSADLIISDNRYGCYSETCKSVLLIHQLNIQVPDIFSLLKPLIDTLHKKIINKFNECWIPDDPDLNISGILSKFDLSIPTTHIGLLSQFGSNSQCKAPQRDILAILSGPEPHRSLLELQLNKTLSNKDSIIQGKTISEKNSNQAEMVSFSYGEEMQAIINNHELIISRSGYSSICDYIILQKRAILIPTPGQTEQEYLAKHCISTHNQFSTYKQNELTKENLVYSANNNTSSTIEYSNRLLPRKIEQTLNNI